MRTGNERLVVGPRAYPMLVVDRGLKALQTCQCLGDQSLALMKADAVTVVHVEHAVIVENVSEVM
jgi:predicted methyltransferase